MTTARPKFAVEHVLAVAARDNYRCYVCGRGYDPRDPWELDHELSVKRGGKHTLSNLRLAHRKCNRDLGAC